MRLAGVHGSTSILRLKSSVGILALMKVRATPKAEQAVSRVREEGREELVLVLGTGCCDSTAPFLYDRYYAGPDAVEIGSVTGVPVYAPSWLADLYEDSEGLELDAVENTVSDSFSLETDHGWRLILRVPVPSR